MFDRSLNEFIVPQPVAAIGRKIVPCARENERIEFHRAFTFRCLFLNIPLRKLYAAGRNTAKLRNRKRFIKTSIIVGINKKKMTSRGARKIISKCDERNTIFTNIFRFLWHAYNCVLNQYFLEIF